VVRVGAGSEAGTKVASRHCCPPAKAHSAGGAKQALIAQHQASAGYQPAPLTIKLRLAAKRSDGCLFEP